jgi:hypothetical protein
MDAKHQACGATALLSSDFPLDVPVVIRCDNKAALPLCQHVKEGQCMKRINIIHHFARDHVTCRKLSFVFCKSDENMCDCLTEALIRPLFDQGLVGHGMM